MDGFLAEQVAAALREARRNEAVKRSRMKVVVGETSYPIIRIDDHGFAIAADELPSIRGYVDLYDGPRRLGRQLVVLASHRDGVASYDYKLQSPEGEAPADYVREREKVAGLLTVRQAGL